MVDQGSGITWFALDQNSDIMLSKLLLEFGRSLASFPQPGRRNSSQPVAIQLGGLGG
jgi:hypothetical protein